MVYSFLGRRNILLELNVNDLEFFKITIKNASGQIEEFNIKDELTINEYDLNQMMYEQPAKYAYWGSVLEKFRAYLESSELQAEVEHANLYEEAVNTLKNEGTAKPTKDQIESWIMRQESYIQLLEQVNVYTGFVKKLNYVVKSFEQRKDMLIQIATDARKEREYENSLKQI